MSKLEITPDHIAGYVKLLDARIKRNRGELLKYENAVQRDEKKRANPEFWLRRDIAEGVKSVSEATGIPLPAKKKNAPEPDKDLVPAPAPRADLGQAIVSAAQATVPTKTKKSEWEDWK